MNNYRGVTLIELMVVVVIIGILASIAYPSYRNYMAQTRRSDGQIALLQAAARQEKFYSDCTRYAANLAGAMNCDANTLGLSNASSPEGYYSLGAPQVGNIPAAVARPCDIGQAGASLACGFAITATPVPSGPQAGDGALRIDALGTKQRNKSGTWVSWTTK